MFFISAKIKMPGDTGLKEMNRQARRFPGTNHSRRELSRSCALMAFLPAGCKEIRFRMPSPVATGYPALSPLEWCWLGTGVYSNNRSLPDFHWLTIDFKPAHWPRVKGADAAFQLNSRKRPVDTGLFFAEFSACVTSDSSCTTGFIVPAASCFSVSISP